MARYRVPINRLKKRKDITSSQIANCGGERHIMCVRVRFSLNLGPLGSQPSSLTNCTCCPLLIDSTFFVAVFLYKDCVLGYHGSTLEALLNTMPSATTHVLSPIVHSSRQRQHCRPLWGTAGHGAEQGKSFLAQRCSASPAADPTGTAGNRARQRKLPSATQPSHIDRIYLDAGSERDSESGTAGRSML